MKPCFDDWLEELRETADADTLTGLAEQISAALDAVKQNAKTPEPKA